MKKSELKQIIKEELLKESKESDALRVWAVDVFKTMSNFEKSFGTSYRAILKNPNNTNIGFAKKDFDELTRAFNRFKSSIVYLKK